MSGNTNTDFTIDSNGTVITARALDYETTPSYTLTVKSRDSSSPSNLQRHVNLEISIAVTPVNEHPPVFTSSSYTHNIQEDTVIGTSLIRVTATDDDNGPQGEVSYSLSSSSFYIDATNGIIRLKAALDRESTSSYSLMVTAHDNDPVTSDRKSANVTV
ncbi:cadherin EGF LAG seven-pass G-type receptor 1-like, partial [Exaiptasia diaphana]|uniref:Cadherin domain-containing protein n=1 Tax=Exaiptasia diaphana TaxID=2652724 RepID=A0A913X816_EXADI